MVAIQDIVRVGDEGYSLWCVEKLVEYRDEPAAVLWRYSRASRAVLAWLAFLPHWSRTDDRDAILARLEQRLGNPPEAERAEAAQRADPGLERHGVAEAHLEAGWEKARS